VTVRPISIRWISDVPSKMVKIVDYRAVSTGQRLSGAVVSAQIQHRLSEGRDVLARLWDMWSFARLEG
jgi:hypothetical protein